jgi:hypothetical protein
MAHAMARLVTARASTVSVQISDISTSFNIIQHHSTSFNVYPMNPHETLESSKASTWNLSKPLSLCVGQLLHQLEAMFRTPLLWAQSLTTITALPTSKAKSCLRQWQHAAFM